MTIAQMLSEREKSILSPYACLSMNSRGREKPISQCDMRTEFQRDRDRIIHCKSFRRLMHKTQVFICPEDDHYRTRLTHTLEVSQIARTIARSLLLNEDLCEAAALGHDLGHTPFGHAGEVVLRECFSSDFTHYKQSLRVVEKLERRGEGLNLTYEVRDAILNHSGSNVASTLEGVIIKYADRIAYINHDIDDACRAKIISPDDIPKELCDILGYTNSERIESMVNSCIRYSTGKDKVEMEPEIQSATDKLREFLFERVYYNQQAKGEEGRAKDMLSTLYGYFVNNPDKLPQEIKLHEEDSIERQACDYIAGMTDKFAINLFENLFIPKIWHV